MTLAWIDRVRDAMREHERERPRYDPLEEIGRGGMAVVHRARDRKLNREVALKVMREELHAQPEDRARFRREAEAAARISHPNVVSMLDAGEEGGRLFLVMELVKGRPLHLVAPSDDDLAILEKVARGVHHAHRQGIVHRDLKPSNILVTENGEPKISDFGVAHLVDSTRLTHSGMLLGTPLYMAPEQVQGRPVTARTDVFALGAILYERITGHPPFEGETAVEIFRKILETDPPKPGVAKDLETVCLKALEKEAERRYASAEEFAEDLRRVQEGQPVHAIPVSTWSRRWRHLWKRRRLILPIAASLVLAAGATSWVAVSSIRRAGQIRRLEADRDDAQAILAKSQAVAKVLRRWSRLQETLRKMEAIHCDSRLKPEEKRAQCVPLWPEIRRFADETPRDSASTATMQALVGWASWLAEDPDAAISSMRQARNVDPDVPFGPLMEALVWFEQYLAVHPVPYVYSIEGDRMRVGRATGEDASLAPLRTRIEGLLAAATLGRVWGKETRQDFDSAMTAIRSFQAGDYACATKAFEEALSSPDLALFETSLLVARARSRYILNDYRGALDDLSRVRAVRPHDSEAHLLAATVHWLDATAKPSESAFEPAFRSVEEALRCAPESAPALQLRARLYEQRGRCEAMRGADPQPSFSAAIADCDRALRIDPDYLNAYFQRGLTLGCRAEIDATKGRPYRETFEAALRDLDEAIRRDPSFVQAHVMRARVHIQWGLAKTADDVDGRESFERAVSDAAQALELEPGHLAAHVARGEAYWNLGVVAFARGADPRGFYRKALEELDVALAGHPKYVPARQFRGKAHARMGEALDARGEDPIPSYERAIADYDEIVRLDPRSPGAHFNRGIAYARRGKAEVKRGKDPRGSYERAIADFDRTLERNASAWQACLNKGLLLEDLGRFAEAVETYTAGQKVHPRPAELQPLLERARKKL